MLTGRFKNKDGMKLPIKPIAVVLGKIIGMLICTFLCVGFFTVIPMLFFQSKPEQGHPSLVQSLVLSPLMLLVGCLVVYTFRTSVDGKSFRGLGFRLNHIVDDTLIGLLFGGGIIAIGSAVVYFFGTISVSAHSFDVSHIWLWLVVFMLAASFEEIVFRGYILNALLDVMPETGALLFSAIIFSVFHGETLVSAGFLLSILHWQGFCGDRPGCTPEASGCPLFCILRGISFRDQFLAST